jgi:hypothetical protein
MTLPIDGDNLLDLPERMDRPTPVRAGDVVLENPGWGSLVTDMKVTKDRAEVLEVIEPNA